MGILRPFFGGGGDCKEEVMGLKKKVNPRLAGIWVCDVGALFFLFLYHIIAIHVFSHANDNDLGSGGST